MARRAGIKLFIISEDPVFKQFLVFFPIATCHPPFIKRLSGSRFFRITLSAAFPRVLEPSIPVESQYSRFEFRTSGILIQEPDVGSQMQELTFTCSRNNCYQNCQFCCYAASRRRTLVSPFIS